MCATDMHWSNKRQLACLLAILPCKLPHAEHVNCNAFSSVDCGWL